jgi:tetratricopeptide (TPR) repeat protein
MATEQDPKKRVTEIERYSEAFRGSKLAQNANVLAVGTFQELNDMPKLMAFGEKALNADPNSVSLLTLMANAFAEDPKGADLPKADTYARKAIELSKADKSTTEENRSITEGFAHQILGYTLLRQEKTAAGISELKTASTMLKGDPIKYSIALYRLGFAYAKSNQTANAKQVLAEAAGVEGPFKQAAKELLDKLNSTKPVPHKK